MVICDLHFVSFGFAPYEANSVLIVDSNAVLTLTIAAQFLQPVSGRNLQVVQSYGAIEHGKLSFRNTGWRCTARLAASPDFRRFLVGESLDHSAIVTLNVNNV